MSNKLKIELIEQYLSDELSEEKRVEFEKSIASDPILAEQVQLIKEVNQAIEDEPLARSVEQQLQFLGNRHFKSNTTKKNEYPQQKDKSIRTLKRRNWAIAAAVLVLVVGGGIVWNMFQGTNADSATLFASHFESYDLGTRSEIDTTLKEIEKQAIQAYSDTQYLDAIPLLEQLVAGTEATDNYRIVLGCSYLKTNQSDKAIDIFTKILENDQSLAHQTAQWYIALAYLQKDDRETAKSKLEELANTGNRLYPKKAKALLKEL